ncbi:hypothetical protein Bp8pS_182 [Bacillus phage vB_BpuM-BpSp]|nr:hypothetical protein Bp8pS_182 [Bacillus phage vB_BpuM-BpSp]
MKSYRVNRKYIDPDLLSKMLDDYSDSIDIISLLENYKIRTDSLGKIIDLVKDDIIPENREILSFILTNLTDILIYKNKRVLEEFIFNEIPNHFYYMRDVFIYNEFNTKIVSRFMKEYDVGLEIGCDIINRNGLDIKLIDILEKKYPSEEEISLIWQKLTPMLNEDHKEIIKKKKENIDWNLLIEKNDLSPSFVYYLELDKYEEFKNNPLTYSNIKYPSFVIENRKYLNNEENLNGLKDNWFLLNTSSKKEISDLIKLFEI